MMRAVQFQKKKVCLLFLALLIGLAGMTQKPITGNVTGGDHQQPVSGASVNIKGSVTGVVTGIDGNFTINTNPGDVLVISNVGYLPKEITVGNQTSINVVLEPSDNTLTEVVITGYSAERKKDITGAVAVVDMKSLKSMPAGSAAQALQGQASGVNVISSGVPGGQSNIFIRGISSFGNTQPLVLIDGVQAQINDISADDIESMQVLKDAGSASVYGVRGSNGVIVITTKKGKSGQPVITYDGYYGSQRPLKSNAFDLTNPTEFMQLYKMVNPTTELFANGLPDYTYTSPSGKGVGNEGDPQVNPDLYHLDINNPSNSYVIQKVNKGGTDWFREIFKPAPMQNHTVTASGGTDKANYLFSLGYLDQQGTLIETYLKRYSVRINTQYNIKKNIRVGENAYVFYKEDRPFNQLGDASGGNVMSMAYRTYNFIPTHDIAGNYGGSFGGPGEMGVSRAPYGYQKQRANDKSRYWNVVGNIFGEIDFLRHFTARTSFGGTIDNQYHFIYRPVAYYNAEGNTTPNRLSENSLYNTSTIWTNTLNYINDFGDHSIKVLLGSEAIKNFGRNVGGDATTFFSDDPDYLVLTNGTQAITNFSNAYVNTLFSLFGRVDYSYDDKYLLGVTVRRDGSSVFGSDKRYGVFPSVSAGWRVSNEKFMQDVSWINDLKLRGSYGVLGSQNNIGPANAFSLFRSAPANSYYDIAGTTNTIQQGFYQATIGNPSTGWEENIVSNIGLDATLFNNKVDFSIDYYKKSINGLLFSLPLPSVIGGAAFPVVNIGDIQNKGVDITLGYRGNISQDLQFFVKGNFTTYKNKVVDIPGTGYFDLAQSRNGTLVRNQKGQEVSSFFGYEVIGLFRDDNDVERSPTQTAAEPGRFKYRDVNGDGSITPDDRTFFGNPNPDFTYGLNLGVNYKQFDLSAILYGSQGNEVLNSTKWYTDFFGSFPAQKRRVLLDAWTPENPDSKIPKVEAASSFSTNGVPNSYYMEDGSYLRLKSLVLGYTVNPSVISKVGLSRLRFYFQAVNLFTITDYSGLDPELTGTSASFGLDFGNYPSSQRMWSFGVNLAF